MNRRKSALVVIAVMAICSVWAGLVAAPASASRQPDARPSTGLDGAVKVSAATWQNLTRTTELASLADGEVAESVTVGVTPAAASSAADPCQTHNWYYRIFLRGTGQNLFLWTFSTEYCLLVNRYFVTMLPSDSVRLRHSSIRGSTVAHRIIATPRFIEGPLLVLYSGAEFQYCPNGTCRQTFRPRLAWIYGIDGTRTYAGLVPLE